MNAKDFWTVREEGGLIAFAYITVLDTRIHLNKLCVKSAFRRRGIARSLIAEIVDSAKTRGVGKITLGVLGGNIPARALYEKMGFVPYAYRSRFSVPAVGLPDSGDLSFTRTGEGYKFEIGFYKGGVQIGRGVMDTEIGGCKAFEIDDPERNLLSALHILKGFLKPEAQKLYVLTNRQDVISECRRRNLTFENEIISMELTVV